MERTIKRNTTSLRGQNESSRQYRQNRRVESRHRRREPSHAFSIFIGELVDYAEALANGPSERSEAEEQLKSISHSLKSSAASFGAERLCEFATRLDARYKTGEDINTSENRETMITCLHLTREEFLKLTQ